MLRSSWGFFCFTALGTGWRALLVLGGLLAACQSPQHSKIYRIGFSQCTGGDLWRKTMLSEMQRELSLHPNFELRYEDAGNNSQRQTQQINHLLAQNIDLLIVSPNESAPVSASVDNVFRRGIPVVVLDRKIVSDSYNTYIGGDNMKIGRMAGEWAAKALGGGGRVVEVWGRSSSSPAQERHQGFVAALAAFPKVQLVAQWHGQWEKDTAKAVAATQLATLQTADLVFAHNDVMAQGVREVCRQHGLRTPRLFAGIDGLPGPQGGLQMVLDGTLTATFLYPTGGQEAIRVAAQILTGKAARRAYPLNSFQIDRTNVQGLKAQSDKLTEQQANIELLNNRIGLLDRTYAAQKHTLYLILAGLGVAVALGIWAYYLMRQKQTVNKKLRQRNRQIIEQKNELEEANKKIRLATEEKLRFYSYISHELKTPLSLILTPAEDLLNQKAMSQRDIRAGLGLVRKNAHRLLRLVNQMLDLRKLDAGKLVLQAAEQDVVAFARDIFEDFRPLAQQHRIDLQFAAGVPALPLWFDEHKLDKILFNLLSNAFKYTPDGGFIHGSLAVADGRVHLALADSGAGMSREEQEQAFDLFYSGQKKYSLGTGLGMALSREFAHLHHGELTVQSGVGTGTTFTLSLPLGGTHLGPAEQLTELGRHQARQRAYVEEDLRLPAPPEALVDAADRISVLLIEDNTELREYLTDRLLAEFALTACVSAEDGWHTLLEIVPDLIVCDVMLPGESGFWLTRQVKADFRTSHIPVVLLTAKGQVQDKIEGSRAGADAYLTKPFSTAYLVQTVRTLFANRAKVQRRFSSTFLFAAEHTSERQFLNELTATIEAEFADPEFSVEQLAQRLAMSRVQLYRKVQALLQTNVSDYITDVRLNKAKVLLRDTSLTIAEIAYATGFNSASYFSTLFRQRLQQTPSEYRRPTKTEPVS